MATWQNTIGGPMSCFRVLGFDFPNRLSFSTTLFPIGYHEGMKLFVRLFARARDLAGAEAVAVEVREGANVAELRRRLSSGYPKLAGLLERSALAVNDELADEAATIPPGAEIALLPPVSGGNGGT